MVIWSPIYSCDYAAITQPLVLIKQPIEARLAQCLAHLPHLNLRLHAILADDGGPCSQRSAAKITDGRIRRSI